ncbi:hypothetical protein [Streptomyces ambofaciens]
MSVPGDAPYIKMSNGTHPNRHRRATSSDTRSATSPISQTRGPRNRPPLASTTASSAAPSHYVLQQAIVDALEDGATDPDEAFRARAAVGACLAAMHTALVRWAEDDGRTGLPALIAQALVAAFGPDAVDVGPAG